MTHFLAALILYTAADCVLSGLLFLPAASVAESCPPTRPARESLVWLTALGLPHLFAAGAVLYAVRIHSLDPVPWGLRDARVRHLCFWSLAESPDAAYRMYAVGALVAGVALVGLLRPVFTLALSWRYSRLLARTSSDVPELGVRLVPLETPWSACVGFLPPRVYVTEGLAKLLDADELEAVIAHESAHAGHGDNLRLIVAQALFGPTIIMPTAHYYYRRLRRSIERAADLRALWEGGSAETLASALVTAARKLREFAPPADERGVRARLALKHREEFVAERAGRVLSARSEHRLTAGCLWLCGTVLVAVLAMHIAGENWLALLREVPHFAEASVRCLFESVLAALSGGT